MVVVVALGCWLRLVAAALFESLILHAQTYEREYNKKEPPTKVGDSRLVGGTGLEQGGGTKCRKQSAQWAVA